MREAWNAPGRSSSRYQFVEAVVWGHFKLGLESRSVRSKHQGKKGVKRNGKKGGTWESGRELGWLGGRRTKRRRRRR